MLGRRPNFRKPMQILNKLIGGVSFEAGHAIWHNRDWSSIRGMSIHENVSLSKNRIPPP